MIFYAKPDQTYSEHIEAVYTAWKATIRAKKHLIDRAAEQYGFSPDRFIKGSLLTIAFHDIGKMIDPFQQMMSDIRQGRPFNKRANYRHELVSFVYTAKYWHLINKDEFLCTVPLEAVAVAGHHRPLDSDLTSFVRESGQDSPPILRDGVMEAIAIAESLFRAEGLSLPSMQQDGRQIDPFKSLAGFIWNALNKGITRDGADKYRVVYSLLKGILHYADWYGSGKQEVVYQVEKSVPAIIENVRDRCKAKGIDFKGLSLFQEACSKLSGHLTVIAPTGSGKTEASILWALRNSEEMGGAKIIYLLPTMVTANNIWDRLVDFFGQENVGLSHSSANLLLRADESAEDEEAKWENRRNILFSRSFIKPVTVGTVDQLLTTGFNAGRWALKEINAANAVIIIDEVHAYDGWTLGLLVSTITHFSKLGARFMVMSATLPRMLRNLLSSRLTGAGFIKDDTLANSVRSRYFVVDDFIESAVSDIRQAVFDGVRVLVVVNTVRSCQDLARQMADLGPLCYHSQFILRDRKSIEQQMQDARLVVATQVVEVSLDIDYDWLFTECAPPDAVVQRAGRVNRYRNIDRDSRVFIFRASAKAEKIYNPINDWSLLDRSFNAFETSSRNPSENDLIEIVERVYDNYDIETSDAFRDAMQQYMLSQKNRSMILDSRTREDTLEVTRQSKYETISVIPKCFMNDVLELKPFERQWYEVKLPLWYVQRNREDIKGITFCDIEYNSFIGATLSQSDKASTIIC